MLSGVLLATKEALSLLSLGFFLSRTEIRWSQPLSPVRLEVHSSLRHSAESWESLTLVLIEEPEQASRQRPSSFQVTDLTTSYQTPTHCPRGTGFLPTAVPVFTGAFNLVRYMDIHLYPTIY